MENLRVGMTSELVMKNTFLGASRRKNMQKMRRKQAIKNMRAQGDMGDQGVFEVSTEEEAMASRIASKQALWRPGEQILSSISLVPPLTGKQIISL